MKTIYRILLISFFATVSFSLFAQEIDQPFSSSYDLSGYTLTELHSVHSVPISVSDNLFFSDFILQNNGLMSATLPAALEPGDRPGDNGAYGAIGQIPVGEGIEILMIMLLSYIVLRRWRLKFLLTTDL